MSVGQWVGAVVGAVIGFYVGGFYGAWVGAGVGYSLGSIVDPVTPDIKTPGVPAQPFQVTPNTVGTVIPDALGTCKVVGFLMAYGHEKVDPVRGGDTGGKGGGGSKSVITGYRYYADWTLGICLGPVDTLCTIFNNEKVVWEGEETRPVAGGEKAIVIEDMGTMHFYFGTHDQVHNDDVGDLIQSDTLNSPLRGMCWAFFHDFYIGEYNRLPTMTFVIRRAPVISFSALEQIRVSDYNPMHAIWYILHHMTGLPETWLHPGDFVAAAATLEAEGRGISMLFDQQQSALSYIENLNTHVDAILRYGSDGTFHPKLIRDDYTVATLPVIDESIMLDKPSLSRKSWIDTINELTVEYSHISRDISYEGQFYPFSICTDGASLFIGGSSWLAGKYYLRIERRSMTGGLLDEVDILYGDGAAGGGGVMAICVDSGSVYIGGLRQRVGSGYLVGTVQRRKKNTLSELVWEHTSDPGGAQNYTVLDIAQDAGGDIYWTGDDTGGGVAYKGRLRQTDGSTFWYAVDAGAYSPNGAGRCLAIRSDLEYVHFAKKGGPIETVRKADGSWIGEVFYSTRSWRKMTTWVNAEGNERAWLVGTSNPWLPGIIVPGIACDPVKVVLVKTENVLPDVLALEQGPSAILTKDAILDAVHGPDPLVPNEENVFEGIAMDDFNAYVVGRAPYSPTSRMRVAKYDSNTMLELWGIDNLVTTRNAVAICVYGTYVYVAGWDSALPHVFFLERRSKVDGRII